MQEVWDQNVTNWRMKSIWLKLKALKPRLKALNNEEFKTITAKIDRSRMNLQDIQEKIATQYNDYLLD